MVGVSRQTIYYLERGIYNPKLTLSFKIAEILKQPIEEIFHLEPVIRDLIGPITIDKLEEISKTTGISSEKILSLRILENTQVSNIFSKGELHKIAEALGEDFNNLFLED